MPSALHAQVLVSTALSSLNQLRSHLTQTLSGLRDATPSTESGLVWHPVQKRWVLHSEGLQDLLVLRVQLPSPNVLGVTSVHTPHPPPGPRLARGLPSGETKLLPSSRAGWLSARGGRPERLSPLAQRPSVSARGASGHMRVELLERTPTLPDPSDRMAPPATAG